MTTIWLARHAETAIPGIFHGAESDIGLSEFGHRQAAAAAEWFRQFAPTAIVSSAMRRAIDTAAPIATACGVPHHIVPELHERRLGSLSGTAVSPGLDHWTETAARWAAGDTAFAPPGAESFDDIRDRVRPAFLPIAAEHAGGRVVVVAHGVVCKVLLLSILANYGPGDWVRVGRVVNLAVSELAFDGVTWTAGRLLEVPDPVAALAASAPSGPKSEG